MTRLLREIRILLEEGKLHRNLLIRLGSLFLISFGLLGGLILNLVLRHAAVLIALPLVVAGFVLGFFLFARMNAMKWNETERVVQAGRMDIFGFIVLILYVAFELGLKTLMKDYFPFETTGYILAAAFGTLFGRAVGMVVEVHRVYKETRETPQ